MSDLKEYVVTAKDWDSVDSLCEDIETEGGDLYIPNRKVEVAHERPNSRNTHYYLSDDEAEVLRNDPRVLAVELTPVVLGMVRRPVWIQDSSNWNKSATDNVNHRNWGLLRCILGQQIANWGSNVTPNQTGTIQASIEGRNVDVVIVDGMIDPAHPEYAVNADGTGGSRVVQYNWFQHSLVVEGVSKSAYVYPPYIDGGNSGRTDDNNHGAHVAGTVAGNTQGWARSSNIYNINPYSTDINGLNELFLFDYIRQFHANKSVNPTTGRKNPTICNNSWGYAYQFSLSSITSITVRGVTTTGPFTVAQARNLGLFAANIGGTDTAIIPAEYPAVDADVEDAIADGIIMVGAAGNDYTKIDVPGGLDYNNRWNAGGFFDFYHRGSSPAKAVGQIVVGAVSSLVNETKALFSNCGPRVDIYAPGTNINSSVHNGGLNDPRNSSYQIVKYNGTSMASPQVCGVLACVLEVYPNLTPAQAMQYVKTYGKNNQMTDTAGGYTDYTSLQGGDNRYLFYYKERTDAGNTWPKTNYSFRSASKMRFPRNRIRRTA
jgi:subtilisin family serine protease